MPEFLVQITFTAPLGSKYWLPIFAEAETAPDAAAYAERFVTGLRANYIEVSVGEPCLVPEGRYREPFKSFIRQRVVGKVRLLEVRYWKVACPENAPTVSFDDQLELVTAPLPPPHESALLASASIHRLPVKKLASGVVPESDEFLLVDVVSP